MSIHSEVRIMVGIEIGNMNNQLASGQTELNQDYYTSNSVMTDPDSTIDRIVIESGSDAVALSPVSLSREKGRSDVRKLDKFVRLSNSSENSPSSDSGIHSYEEEWAISSTKSRNSDSVQSSESARSIVISPVEKRIVPSRQRDAQFDRGVVNSLQAKLVRHGSMSYLSTNGYNSDVAAMADFSDEDYEPWEDDETCVEEQPSLQTDSVDNEAINNVLGSYDYAMLHKIPPVAVPHDPDDEFNMDYWINFRTLLNKALTLDDITLSENDYPEIVKAFILRYRWTLLVREEPEDVRFTVLYDSDEEED